MTQEQIARIERAAQAIAAITDPGRLWNEIPAHWQEHHRKIACAALDTLPQQNHEFVRADALEAAAQIADSFNCGGCGMDGKAAKAIRLFAELPSAAAFPSGTRVTTPDTQ